MGAAAIPIAAAVAGSAVASMLAPKPNIPQPQAPTPPPQASKAPDASSTLSGMQGTGQAGGSPGVAQTMLTGPGGVDPDLLKLGSKQSTLLGN